MESKPNRGQASGDSAKAQAFALKVAKNLSKAISIAQLYPEGHPMHSKLIKLLEDFFKKALTIKREIVTLAIGKRLVVNGIALDERIEGIPLLLDSLKKRGLRGFTIRRGISVSELVAFLKIMTTKVDKLNESGGAVASLKAEVDTKNIFLVEISRSRSTKETSETDLSQLESIISKYVFDENPELSEDEIELTYKMLSDPEMISKILKLASEMIRQNGGLSPVQISSMGAIERIYADLEKAGKTMGPEIEGKVADAMELMDQGIAKDLLREKILSDADLSMIIGSDLEKTAREELVKILVHNHMDAEKLSPDLIRSIRELFPGENGRHKLISLLRQEMKATGESQQNFREVINSILEKAFPKSPGRHLNRDSEEVIELIETIEKYNLKKDYIYALMELTFLSMDIPTISSAMDTLLGATLEYLTDKEYGLAKDIIFTFRQLSSGVEELPTDAVIYARDICEQLTRSDVFRSFLDNLNDEELQKESEIWEILSNLRGYMLDWIIDRVVSSSDPEIKAKLSNLIIAMRDQIAPKIRRKLENVMFSQAEDLLMILYQADRESFYSLCEKHLGKQDLEDQIDVIKFLGKLGDEDSVKVFRRVLEDKNEKLKVEGLLSLGKIGGTEAKEILRETARRGSLFRRNYEIQKAAVQALGGMGDEVAMPILGSILRSRFSLRPKKNNELRLQAAIALRKIATDEAMDFLRKTCSDKNSEIRNFSIAAIKTFDRGPEG